MVGRQHDLLALPFPSSAASYMHGFSADETVRKEPPTGMAAIMISLTGDCLKHDIYAQMCNLQIKSTGKSRMHDNRR